VRMHRASLLKTVTSDGLCEMGDHVKAGDVYYVDLDRVQYLKWGHTDRVSEEIRLSIWSDASPNGGHAGWMPTELFDLPKLEVSA
jgi:hypothetical protein